MQAELTTKKSQQTVDEPKSSASVSQQREDAIEAQMGMPVYLQRSRQANGTSTSVPSPLSEGISSLQGGGQALSGSERKFFESRIGADFSNVRVHDGQKAGELAQSVGARAFTYGNNIVFGTGEYSPDSLMGKKLLAHELTHVVQQNPGLAIFPAVNRPVRAPYQAHLFGLRPSSPVIQRDLTDPGRLATVHGNVMVSGPPRRTVTGATAARRPWVDPDPTTGSGGTAQLLYNQIFSFLDNRIFDTGGVSHTTESDLDADAVVMHQRVVDYYPQISSRLSDTEIQNRVGLLVPATIQNDLDYLNQWMDNFIDQMSDSEEYDIDPDNTAYRDMINRLIANKRIRPKILALAASQPAYTAGEGAARQVFVHRTVAASERRLSLIHEITHFYRHQRYRDWVDSTRDVRHYDEGLTEWLARRLMTPAEQNDRQTSYDERVDTINTQIAAHISEDGIARAYFAGEVWRLETRSVHARAVFEAQTGIREGVTHREEGRASRGGAGLFQTVIPDSHFRFLNLGRDQAQPKAEHVDAFRQIKASILDQDATKRVRFVGHASGPGTDAYNLDLSRRRAIAFYRMAEREGLPRSRLVDVNNPPHSGESLLTVTEEDVITRAMNRRVEMFIVT